MTSTTIKSPAQQVLITRVFDAPREVVFRAWTDPAQLLRWFAPPGCRIEYRQIEVQKGGVYHSCIHTPDGHECWCKGEYLEVTEPSKLVLSMCISNEQGDTLQAADVGMDPDWPQQTILTVAFDEQDGRTKLTLHQTVDEALAKRTGAYPSWIQMLDRLAEELAA